ncbi:MAG: glycosyltransferase [Candidatus Aenigmarchaeota archaeon]|nr:glycosyltransferase [Candidatus Aenigmarchaeota archaeon]
MRIVFALCSWGLGHATRSLPLIRRLVKDGHQVDIICSGRPLEFLKKNMSDSVGYVRFPEQPDIISSGQSRMLFNLVHKTPELALSLLDEKKRFKKYQLKNSPDIVISDSRYGIDSSKVPSFFISHQLRLMSPYLFKPIIFTEFFNKCFMNYNKLIVPDFDKDSISGDLSHGLVFTERKKVEYIGVLSDFRKVEVKKDIDCMISISGPEDARVDFEKKVFEQLDSLDGNVVVSLGKTGSSEPVSRGNAQVYDYMDKDTRENCMNRAKIVVSRSGYSTIMDLYVLRKKALYIPTPGQTEQEYLARYLKEKEISDFVSQDRLDISEDLAAAKRYKGFTKRYDVKKSVDNFMDVIFESK